MLRAPGATMDLIAQLRQQICSYLRGLSTLADLRLWLADHVQEISDAGDAELDELDGLIWVLVSELDYGHRAEESVRTELAAVVDPVQVTGGWAVEHMVASTTAAVIRTSSCFHTAYPGRPGTSWASCSRLSFRGSTPKVSPATIRWMNTVPSICTG
jgi:hypothetical protein